MPDIQIRRIVAATGVFGHIKNLRKKVGHGADDHANGHPFYPKAPPKIKSAQDNTGIIDDRSQGGNEKMSVRMEDTTH